MWPGTADLIWPAQLEDGWVANWLEALRLALPEPNLLSAKRFETSSATMKALEYERCVGAGSIPTRDQYHDLFNGLVWLAYPAAKSHINHLHVQEGRASAHPLGTNRSRLRDAITLFDESGLILLTSNPEVALALERHDWIFLFVTLRQEWGVHILPFCFGHGLLDALRKPHKALCAKVKVVQVDAESLKAFREVDDPTLFSASFTLDQVFLSVIHGLGSPRDFNPLPVMGIPGWFDVNESVCFYEDETVFRKKPTRRDLK